jgi:predicted nucleotidyltransferase
MLMRLSPQSQAIIHQAVVQRFGDLAQVRLFGSRLDDTAKGGDIDLHVRVQGGVLNPIWEASLLAAQLQRQLDGRKVDVRLLDETQNALPVDALALSQGILLT